MISSSSSTPAVRVLVVDDHPDLLSMLDIMMQRRSYEVKTASSGNEALQLAPDFAPHVVVSDISMPGMDGLQMMQLLREQLQAIPFRSIALTGHDSAANDDTQNAGYDAQLPKPVEFEQLFEMIEVLASQVGSFSS